MVTRYFLTVAALLAITIARSSDTRTLEETLFENRESFEDGEIIEEIVEEWSETAEDNDFFGDTIIPSVEPPMGASAPARKSSRIRAPKVAPTTQYRVPLTYTIPGRGTISIPGSNAIKIGKPKRESFDYNVSSNAAPFEIMTDDTIASVPLTSLPMVSTATTVTPHIDEIVLIPTKNPLRTTASGGITKRKGSSQKNPLVVELRPRIKKHIRKNDMTDELDWETSKLIAAVEGYRERGQEVSAQAKKWYTMAKNKKTKGLSRQALDILESEKFAIKEWEFKHVHHRSKKTNKVRVGAIPTSKVSKSSC